MAAGNPNNLLNVTVDAGQTISGAIGVEVPGANGTVQNSGTINGLDVTVAGVPILGTSGVQLDQGGTVTNNPTGIITGAVNGIEVQAGTGTVDNSGTVAGTGPSGIGVDLLGGGTLVNAGTISGASGVAVNIGGTGGSRLVLDAGQVLNGSAQASGSNNTLELAVGTGTGQISDIGATIKGFDNTIVDPNASFAITGGITTPEAIALGSNASLAIGGPVAAGVNVDLGGTSAKLTLGNVPGFQGTLSNLGTDDTLDLANVGADAVVTLNPTGTALSITTAAGVTSVIPVSLAQGLDPASLALSLGSDGNGGLDLTLAVGGTNGTGGNGTGGTGAGGTGAGGAGAGGTTAPPSISDGSADSGTGSVGSGTGQGASGGTGGRSSGAGSDLAVPPSIGGTPTNTNAPTISGSAVPGSSVTLYDSDGKTVLGTANADPTTGAYSITSTPLGDGLHTLTTTDTVNGQTSQPSAGLQFDIDTHDPQNAFDPTVSVSGPRNVTLRGSVSDVSGVKSVEVFAGGKDIGAATINPDGTWHIGYSGKAGFTNQIAAVATDGAGNQSIAPSNYDLTTGIKGQPYTSIQDDFDPSTSDFLGETFFDRNGGEVYKNTLQQFADGNSRYTYTGGNFFNGKNYYSFQDTYDSNNNTLEHTKFNNDGTHSIYGQADGQTLHSIHDDVMTGGGVNEQFVFTPAAGQETVTDFIASGPDHDTLKFVDSGLTSLADVLSHTSMVGGDAVIHLPNNTNITLAGIDKAELKAHPGDFKFHA